MTPLAMADQHYEQMKRERDEALDGWVDAMGRLECAKVLLRAKIGELGECHKTNARLREQLQALMEASK